MAQGKYDIVVDGVGYMLAEAENQSRDIIFSHGPAELQAEIAKSRDVPIVWDDFSGGMGYSERLLQGTYAWAINGYTRSPRLFLPGPKQWPITLPSNTAKITDIIEFEGNLYFLAGQYLLKSSGGSSDTLTVDADFGGSFVGANMALFTDTSQLRTLYVGSTSDDRLWRRRPGSTWEYAPDPGLTAPYNKFGLLTTVYFAQRASKDWKLIAQSKVHPEQAWICAKDPFTVGDWSPLGQVTDGLPIKSFASSNRRFYPIAANGIFEVDETGYVGNRTPYWNEFQNEDNGMGAVIFNGAIWALHHQGLDRLDLAGQGFIRQDISDFVHPGVGLPNESPIYGAGTAITQEGGWVVLSQFNGTDSHISYGRESKVTGVRTVNLMTWHGSEITIRNGRVTKMKVSSLSGYTRLWIAYTDNVTGFAKLVFCTIPEGTPLQDWLNGGYHRFSESCELYLPAEDWGRSTARKDIIRYDIQGDGLGEVTGNPIKFDVAVDTDKGGFVDQGSVVGSPRYALFPEGDFLSGYRHQIKITGSAYTPGYGPGSFTYPPILRAIQARAGMIVEQRKTRRYRIRLGGGNDRNGTPDKRDPGPLLTHLEQLQEADPVLMTDELGNVLTVKVESGISGQINRDALGFKREEIVEVLFSIITRGVNASPTVIPGPTGDLYDSGKTYDGGAFWG